MITPAEVVQRAESEGIHLTWRMVGGVARISAELPEDLDEAPGWLIEEKATWDPEGVRQAIMGSGSKNAALLDAKAVYLRCKREGIVLTKQFTEDGPTVRIDVRHGETIPTWLSDWSRFNQTDGAARLLALTDDDAADYGEAP